MGVVERGIVMEFLDEFDENLAKVGPPAVFTKNHEGRLQFDLLRSRDIARQNPNATQKSWCHCIYIDQATQWPQYVLVTSPQLCLQHERSVIEIYSSYEEAITREEALKQVCYERAH